MWGGNGVEGDFFIYIFRGIGGEIREKISGDK